MNDVQFKKLVENLKPVLFYTLKESYCLGKNNDINKGYNVYRYEHCIAVADLAYILAKEHGVTGDDLQDIYLAGLLHDIAKYDISKVDHAVNGASIAKSLLMIQNKFSEARIDRICGYIYTHSCKNDSKKKFPFLNQILIEVDVLEKMNTKINAYSLDLYMLEEVSCSVLKILKKLALRKNYLKTKEGIKYYKNHIDDFMNFAAEIIMKSVKGSHQ